MIREAGIPAGATGPLRTPVVVSDTASKGPVFSLA